MAKDVRLTVMVEEAIADAVFSAARDRDMSMSAWIREAAREKMAREHGHPLTLGPVPAQAAR